MTSRRFLQTFLLAFAFVAFASAAGAMEYPDSFESIPEVEPAITNWMTSPATPLATQVRNYTLFVSILLSPFLLLPQGLLLYAIFKFRAAPGRKPATFHENVRLEVFWTVVPALALVVMAVPSYQLIKNIETMPEADVNVEVYGHQFFWRYSYPDHGVEISNQPLVVPVNSTIVNHMTSVDVNHAWWVPAFGVKMDTIPGRISQVWYEVGETGWYKGQCAELCGALHARMLIDVWVVTQEEFDEWIEKKKAEAASFGDEEPAGEGEEAEADAMDTTAGLTPLMTGKAALPAA